MPWKRVDRKEGLRLPVRRGRAVGLADLRTNAIMMGGSSLSLGSLIRLSFSELELGLAPP